MILRKFFSVASSAEAIQRFTMPLSRQRQTRRVRKRTPAWGLSMMLVVARQRCSEGGTSSRLMVKHSSIPSIRLEAAEGYPRSSQSASFFKRAMPALASNRQAARMADFHLVLLIFREVVHHVAQFMSSTALHRVLMAKYGVDRRAQRLRAVHNEESLVL